MKQNNLLTKEALRLEYIATEMREEVTKMIQKAGSGHIGGSLSAVDFVATLYFGRTSNKKGELETILRYDPKNPKWEDRDRFVMSKGHACPAQYAALSLAGFFDKKECETLRQCGCTLQGHSDMNKTPGIDISTGSLGQGLSYGAGMAHAARISKKDYKVYVLCGDGEFQEGMIWEAAREIPNKELNNICLLLDYNNLQIDGKVSEINSVDSADKELKALGWEVCNVNMRHGNKFYSRLLEILDYFKNSKNEKPVAIIGRTTKGKGIKAIEDNVDYHGKLLEKEKIPEALKAFEQKKKRIASKVDIEYFSMDSSITEISNTNNLRFKQLEELEKVIAENPINIEQYKEDTPTRLAYNNALIRLGNFNHMVLIDTDLHKLFSSSLEFYKKYPDRAIDIGIQECNAIGIAAGLASCNYIPVFGSIAVFAIGRPWEILRQSFGYSKQGMILIGSHAGIATGADGATHQSIYDIGLALGIPNMVVLEASDAIQTEFLFEEALKYVVKYNIPVYLRLGRNPTKLIYREYDNLGFKVGGSYILKEGKDITFLASGRLLPEVLEAAQKAKKKDVGVVDVYSIRPFDREMLKEISNKTGLIVTAQDHLYNGGLGDIVAKEIIKGKLNVEFDEIGLDDYAESGETEDLYDKFGLSARSILEKYEL